jgi:hypothetical protein
MDKLLTRIFVRGLQVRAYIIVVQILFPPLSFRARE